MLVCDLHVDECRSKSILIRKERFHLYYWLFSIQLIYLTMNSVQEETIQFQSENYLVSSLDASAKIEGRWNRQEHLKFLNAIVRYGKDWKKVEDQVSNRTGAQVRSHAQKYFLKINKIMKDRKKIKGKKMPDITETELELKEYFACYPLTTHTPKQIIELLKIEKVGIKNIIEENCNGNQKLKIQQLFAPTIKLQKKKTQKTKIHRPSPQILEAIQNQVNQFQEDSSILLMIIRRNKEYFFNGGAFSAFIDYGCDLKKQKIAIDEQETTGHRKHSFTQFDGEILEH